MEDEIKEKILKKLNENNGRNIVIKQIGFIESKFFINNMKYETEFDIITIKDDKEDIYINVKY